MAVKNVRRLFAKVWVDVADGEWCGDPVMHENDYDKLGDYVAFRSYDEAWSFRAGWTPYEPVTTP